jgi:PBP1b-binding outer membrane lipoprotein LpoB
MRALAVCLLLAGCVTAPAPSVVVGKAEPVRIEVPVVVPCIDQAQIDPVPPSSMPPRTAGVAELAAGAAADVMKYRELAQKQQMMLRACAQLGAKP